MKNIKRINKAIRNFSFPANYGKPVLALFVLVLTLSNLNACAPATKTGSVENETITANEQSYEKIKVSPEAATRALAARERFNQERPSQPFEVTLGDITFKIIPGDDPEYPDNPFRVDNDNYRVYSDYSKVPMNRLFAAVAKDIISATTTIKWRDIIDKEEDVNNSFEIASLDNFTWLHMIESCDYGLEAFLGLAGVKGFENVKWEDYCHPGIPKAPPKPVKGVDYR